MEHQIEHTVQKFNIIESTKKLPYLLLPLISPEIVHNTLSNCNRFPKHDNVVTTFFRKTLKLILHEKL